MSSPLKETPPQSVEIINPLLKMGRPNIGISKLKTSFVSRLLNYVSNAICQRFANSIIKVNVYIKPPPDRNVPIRTDKVNCREVAAVE